MSSDQNKVITRRFIEEVLNGGDLAAIDEYMAADYVEHSAPTGFPATREGTRMAFTLLRHAFPDFHYTIEHLIAEGDWVAIRMTGHGTMRGAFRGLSPTGNQASWAEVHYARLKDGKIVEHWDVKDDLSRLRQLGYPPLPEKR